MRPGREPCTLPLYSNHTVAPDGATATRSISTPTSTTCRRTAELEAPADEQRVALLGELPPLLGSVGLERGQLRPPSSAACPSRAYRCSRANALASDISTTSATALPRTGDLLQRGVARARARGQVGGDQHQRHVRLHRRQDQRLPERLPQRVGALEPGARARERAGHVEVPDAVVLVDRAEVELEPAGQLLILFEVAEPALLSAGSSRLPWRPCPRAPNASGRTCSRRRPRSAWPAAR